MDYTQTALAESMGVTPQTVSRWESGGFMPDIEKVKRIATLLRVDPGWLAFGEIRGASPPAPPVENGPPQHRPPEVEPEEPGPRVVAPNERTG